MADSKISDLTAITNAEIATSDLIHVVDVGSTVNKKMTFAELDTRYAAFGTISAVDGSASSPGFQFTDDTNLGIWRSGTDTMEIGAGGYSGIQVKKSSGNYSNLGFGGNASTSDSFIMLAERDIAAGLNFQISNPSSTTTSFCKILVKGGTGSISTGEVAVYHNSYSFVDAYDTGRYVLRMSGSGSANSGISLVADDASNSIRMYTGGVTSADRVFEAHDGGYVTLNGGLRTGITTKTSNYTATTADHTIICDATSGAITITLPAASSSSGHIYVIKKIDASNNVIIDGNASETIDGATTVTLSTQYNGRIIQCDGSNWHILASI